MDEIITIKMESTSLLNQLNQSTIINTFIMIHLSNNI